MAPTGDIRKELKDSTCRINKALASEGLSPLTWGNASAADRETNLMVIKPSGVPYEDLRADLLSVVRLEDGSFPEKGPKPSSDTETHRVLYTQFPEIGGIVHTHSPAATAWAQARKSIPLLGTTHADHFHGPVPLCRDLTEEEIDTHYTRHTGLAIVDTFISAGLSPLEVPAVLLPGHGAFAWGRTPDQALENAVALEHVARMALDTLLLNPEAASLPEHLSQHHYRRKHGPEASYGQL